MLRRWLGCGMVVLLISLSAAYAQDAETTEEPSSCAENQTLDEKQGACVEHGTLELSLRTPQWLPQYPILQDIVGAYTTQQRMNFLTSVFTLPQDRALIFDLDYEEFQHSERFRSVLFRVNYDIGDAVPLGEIQSFTFDLELGIPFTLDELIEGQNPLNVFPSRLAQEDIDAGFTSLVTGGLDDPSLFDQFVLAEEEIIFYYPSFRQGATEAGTFQASIPLADLRGFINIPAPGESPE